MTEPYDEYDEEDGSTHTYSDLRRGIPGLESLQAITLNNAVIPYWKEVLVYFCYPLDRKCWQGFWVEPDYPNKELK